MWIELLKISLLKWYYFSKSTIVRDYFITTSKIYKNCMSHERDIEIYFSEVTCIHINIIFIYVPEQGHFVHFTLFWNLFS